MRILKLTLSILALAAVATAAMAVAPHRAAAPTPSPTPTQSASVTAASPSPVPTASPTPTPAPSQPITLIFGGDVMLGRTVQSRIEQYGGTWPLQKLGPTMAAADLTVVNLEGPFKENAPQTLIGSLVLRADPAGLPSLTEAGIDLVSLANNHIPDMGLTGLQQTEQLLDSAHIAHAGAGETAAQAAAPVILTAKGEKIGFLSYTYGVNFDSPGVYYSVTDPAQVAKDVAALKPQVDAVIVLAHFGIEYHTTQTDDQEAFAHAAIDAGASLVVGAHPHVAEPIEQYKGGLIFYSLGNLVFDQAPGDGRDYSALAQVTLTGGKATALSLLPYRIYDYGQPALVTTQSEKQQVWNSFNLPSGHLAL